MSVKVLILSILILLSACRHEKGGEKKEVYLPASPADIAVNFDGKPVRGWQVTNFGPQGPVSASGDEIILGMGDGCTGITWISDFPTANYEVSLEARRVEGNDFFCGLTFPAGKEPCTLIVGGWGGTTVGLSSVDGLDASDNNTRLLMQFDKNKWYRIRLRVAERNIKAWIDSSLVVDFDIGNHKLSVRPEVYLSRPFGIASWNTTAAIRNVQVISLK